MAKQNQKPKTKKNNKNNKNKKPKNKKNDKTQLSATTPPLGVCSLVFFWGVLGFLASYFLVRCCFVSAMANKTKKQKNKKPEQHETKQKNNTKKNVERERDIYIYTSHYL